MKQLITFYYLILFSLVAYGQNYTPTIVENKIYEIAKPEGAVNGGGFSYQYYHIACDTVINDKTYYEVNDEYYDEARGWVREDTTEQKIYFWSQDSTSETLVVDYSLEIGDFFIEQNGYENEVIDIYYENGLKHIEFFNQILFIEGIGQSMRGIILHNNGWAFASTHGWADSCGIILNTTSHSIIEDESLNIHPNPADQFISIDTDSPSSLTYQIHDSTGRLMASGVQFTEQSLDIAHLPNGIYFISLIKEQYTITKKFLIQRQE